MPVYSPVDGKYIAQTFTADALEQRRLTKLPAKEELGLESQLEGHFFNWRMVTRAGGTKKELT